MHTKRRMGQLGLLLAAALILAIGAAQLNAQERSEPVAQTDGTTIQPPRPVGAAARAEVAPRTWTEAEMKAAIPYPLKSQPAAPVANGAAAPAPANNAKPQVIAGQLSAAEQRRAANQAGTPNAAASEAAPEAALDTVQFGGASPLGYSYPYPFTRFQVFTTYNASPYNKIGKLFFRQYGVGYVCSAASQGNRGIITAGHCLHAGNNDPRGWSTNVVFVPAYKDGAAPYGQWVCDYATQTVFTVWYQRGLPNRDVAGCRTINHAGRTLSNTVGSLGFGWNFSSDQHWFAFGYPAGAPFNGNRLIVCAASRARWDMTTVSPATQGIGCDMTGGSSGGPWLLAFSAGGGYVNGVNSYKYTSQPNGMFSPYFDSVVKTGIYDNIVRP